MRWFLRWPLSKSTSQGTNCWLLVVFFASLITTGSSFVPHGSPRSQVIQRRLNVPTFGNRLSVRFEPRMNRNALQGIQDDGENIKSLDTILAPEDTAQPAEESIRGEKHVVTTESVNELHEKHSAVSLLSSVGESLARAMKTISSNHAAFAATILLFLAVFLGPLPSLAVGSGGRMGGSFGPSERSSSVRTYTAPSSSYSRGFSSGYYSRPSVVVTPSVPVVTPYYSPFYSPFWSPRPSGVVVSTGPSFFGVFGFLAVALVAFSVFSSTISSVGSSVMDRIDTDAGSALGPGVSVAQITVALDVPNRDDPSSILSVLNRLSNTARTDSRVGLSNLTSQVALELLRRRQSIVASSSRHSHFRDRNKASREFNKLAVKERGKFERETVSKYGGVDYSSGDRRAPETTQFSPKATMAVVTIIVAIEGDSTKMPNISSLSDVENALSRIASDAKVDDCLQSAEILWTPEERSETLTMREVISDYPSLRTI